MFCIIRLLRMMNVERIDQVRIRMPIVDQFSGIRKDIQSSVSIAIEKTKKHLPLRETTIRIKNDPKGVIPGYAHGAWTFSADNIVIKVNPNIRDREQFLKIELPRSISHELHHSVRSNQMMQEPRTLGTFLIYEGLATCFETEVWGGQLSNWANALSNEQILEILPKVFENLDNPDYSHARWFFGTDDMPKWAGYTIGVYLIKKYLSLHPNETAASLVMTPSKEILDEVKVALLNGNDLDSLDKTIMKSDPRL